jgi:hypothetical protein
LAKKVYAEYFFCPITTASIALLAVALPVISQERYMNLLITVEVVPNALDRRSTLITAFVATFAKLVAFTTQLFALEMFVSAPALIDGTITVPETPAPTETRTINFPG